MPSLSAFSGGLSVKLGNSSHASPPLMSPRLALIAAALASLLAGCGSSSTSSSATTATRAAAAIASTAYVAGGWNGIDTNRHIYRVSPAGSVSSLASIPQGVRYPAVGALGGRLIIAGGETTSGSPTTHAWSFDPATDRVTR